MSGETLAILGLALCAGLCGVGSAVGLYLTGSAAAGVLADEPKKFSKVLLLVVLPATQGIYGFVFGILGLSAFTAMSGNPEAATIGARIFGAAMPLAITGLVSGILQGKTAVGGIYAVAKNESISGKLILFPAMVETYAILGLVVSILLLP